MGSEEGVAIQPTGQPAEESPSYKKPTYLCNGSIDEPRQEASVLLSGPGHLTSSVEVQERRQVRDRQSDRCGGLRTHCEASSNSSSSSGAMTGFGERLSLLSEGCLVGQDALGGWEVVAILRGFFVLTAPTQDAWLVDRSQPLMKLGQHASRIIMATAALEPFEYSVLLYSALRRCLRSLWSVARHIIIREGGQVGMSEIRTHVREAVLPESPAAAPTPTRIRTLLKLPYLTRRERPVSSDAPARLHQRRPPARTPAVGLVQARRPPPLRSARRPVGRPARLPNTRRSGRTAARQLNSRMGQVAQCIWVGRGFAQAAGECALPWVFHRVLR